MRVTVIEDQSDLHRTVWRFYWAERFGVILDSWRDEKRQTRRHHFRASQYDHTSWERLAPRDNRIEPPLAPEHVKAQALEDLRAKIVFAETPKMPATA